MSHTLSPGDRSKRLCDKSRTDCHDPALAQALNDCHSREDEPRTADDLGAAGDKLDRVAPAPATRGKVHGRPRMSLPACR